MINVSRLYCGIENPSDNFRYRSDGKSGPVIVYNCTNKCNQNCLHCYSGQNSLSGNELDTKQAKDLLKQLSDIKSSVVLFSGGEPLERKDLFELLDFAGTLGLRCALSTNGSLINSDIAKKLIDAGVKYAGISIDGNQKTHDDFRRTKNSFTKALDAISFCKNAGLKTGLRFTITNRNFSQIKVIFSLAAMLSIARICFYHLISAGNATKNYLKCTNDQTRHALNDICDFAQVYSKQGVKEILTVGNHADGPFLLNRLKLENSPLYRDSFNLLEKFGGNKIGVKIFAVDPAGNVHPDQFWRNFSLGNVTEKKLNEIIKNSFDIFKDKTLFAPEKCKNCKWLSLCGTNARFYSHSRENGNPESGFLEPDCYLNEQEIS